MGRTRKYTLEFEVIDGKGIRIAETAVGRGVFATRKFPKNALVGEVTGERIDDANYESEYCMWLGGNVHLEPQAPFRFLNHSCEPNCDFDIFEVEEVDKRGKKCFTDRVYIYATRKIRRGDELTLDYCWPADAAIPCGCGAPSCRGWVVCVTEIPFLELEEGE